MGNLTQRILTPLAYLRVKRNGKWTEELVLPFLLSAATVAAVYALGEKFSVYGNPGLINSITSYFQLLSGFFITALAAIATFNRQGLDDPMLGDPPTLTHAKDYQPEMLSRRRFLCFLFGYLAFGSLVIYFSGTIITLAAPVLNTSFSDTIRPLIKWGALLGFTFLSFNILLTSLLGLYYLTDRLHRDPPSAERIEPDSVESDDLG